MAKASAAWFLLAVLAALLLGRAGAAKLLARLVPRKLVASPKFLLAFVVLLLGALLFVAAIVLDAFPNSGDEYAYVLQAQTYAGGRIWADAPVPPLAFQLIRFIEKGGKWISIYQPGWPMLLAIAEVLKLPMWLVSPVLGAITAWAFFRLVRRLAGIEASFIALVALCTSSFFILNFGSFFSHGAGALTAVLFALCGVLYLERGEARWAILAGASVGALGFIRAANAVLVVAPFVCALLLTRGRRAGLLWLGLGGLPFALAVLAYNHAITGDFLLPVQSWATNGSEPIGAASKREFGETGRRMVRLFLWTSPVFCVAWPAAFLALARRKRLSFVDWIAPVTVGAFVLYGGHGGNQYGPRYYFEAWPLALVTLAKAVEPLLAEGKRKAEWVAAGVLAHLAFQIGYLGPRLVREHQVVIERQDLYRDVAAAGLTNAVVLVIGDAGTTRPLPARDLLRNGLIVGDEPVTYALDREDGLTRQVRERFANRRFYRYLGGKLHDAVDSNGNWIPKPR